MEIKHQMRRTLNQGTSNGGSLYTCYFSYKNVYFQVLTLHIAFFNGIPFNDPQFKISIMCIIVQVYIIVTALLPLLLRFSLV